ncbi:hypothetical protein EW026_g8015 [Hermanssonia centrifuga]|uniref:Uncharacterized protein n=1 Tax=Hermanssonia centrifuga TaxID=98765 RepID=A0A4S4K5V7_9APHY|nr:hypothetical protein EW026_g8015 [Hermanssonia centrifuga]
MFSYCTVSLPYGNTQVDEVFHLDVAFSCTREARANTQQRAQLLKN